MEKEAQELIEHFKPFAFCIGQYADGSIMWDDKTQVRNAKQCAIKHCELMNKWATENLGHTLTHYTELLNYLKTL